MLSLYFNLTLLFYHQYRTRVRPFLRLSFMGCVTFNPSAIAKYVKRIKCRNETGMRADVIIYSVVFSIYGFLFLNQAAYFWVVPYL